MKYEVRIDETLIVDIPRHHVLTNNGPSSVFILDKNGMVAAEIKNGQRWIHPSKLALRGGKSNSLVDVSECGADDMMIAASSRVYDIHEFVKP